MHERINQKFNNSKHKEYKKVAIKKHRKVRKKWKKEYTE